MVATSGAACQCAAAVAPAALRRTRRGAGPADALIADLGYIQLNGHKRNG